MCENWVCGSSLLILIGAEHSAAKFAGHTASWICDAPLARSNRDQVRYTLPAPMPAARSSTRKCGLSMNTELAGCGLNRTLVGQQAAEVVSFPLASSRLVPLGQDAVLFRAFAEV